MEPNLELRRKTWEALGWKRDRDGDGWWHSPKCATDQSGHRDYAKPDVCDYPSHRADEDLPPIESNTGIALEELVKFCEHKLGWRVEETDTVRCMIFRRGMIVGNQDMTVGFAKGVTPAEAICKAICAAKERA